MAELKVPLLKRSSTAFLQGVLVLFGVGVFAIMLWEPHIEGRNAHATVYEVYFNDPFLAYAYLASLPFFFGLYHGFKVLGYAGQDQIFSPAAVRSLRSIKYCAIAMVGLVVGAEIFIFSIDSDDRAGGVFIGVVIAFGSIVTAALAATVERILQNAVDMKSENDLTV